MPCSLFTHPCHFSACQVSGEILFECSHNVEQGSMVAPRPELNATQCSRSTACWAPGKTKLSGFDSSSVWAVPSVAHRIVMVFPQSHRLISLISQLDKNGIFVHLFQSSFTYKWWWKFYWHARLAVVQRKGLIPCLTQDHSLRLWKIDSRGRTSSQPQLPLLMVTQIKRCERRLGICAALNLRVLSLLMSSVGNPLWNAAQL